MAKTLIGNIKGKNGRGITSIKKTGTTGPVDTYTITYTDDTTSTFTVNNSDSISLQRQIVPSAAVESSSTASQAYAAGDYVVVNGVLRKVKSSISKGDTISDSNSIATTVTGELANRDDSASRSTFTAQMSNISSDNKIHGIKHNGIVSVWLDGAATLSSKVDAWSSMRIATIPSGFRPKETICVPLVSDSGVGMVNLSSDGSVSVVGRGSSISGNVTFSAVYDAGL